MISSENGGGKSYLRPKQAMAVLGLPRSSFYRLIANGVLPAPVKLTARTSLFDRDELELAVRSRAAKKGGKNG